MQNPFAPFTGSSGQAFVRPNAPPKVGARIIAPPYHPCDASCQKSPPDASQNLEPPPYPIETKCLTTS